MFRPWHYVCSRLVRTDVSPRNLAEHEPELLVLHDCGCHFDMHANVSKPKYHTRGPPWHCSMFSSVTRPTNVALLLRVRGPWAGMHVRWNKFQALLLARLSKRVLGTKNSTIIVVLWLFTVSRAFGLQILRAATRALLMPSSPLTAMHFPQRNLFI